MTYWRLVLLSVLLPVLIAPGVFASVPVVSVHAMPSGNSMTRTPVLAVSAIDALLGVDVIFGVVVKSFNGGVIEQSYQDVSPDDWSNKAPQNDQGEIVTYNIRTILGYNTSYNIELYVRNTESENFSLALTRNFKTLEAVNVVYVTGNSQEGSVLATLNVPLTVRIYDDYGFTAAQGTTVNFSLYSEPVGAAGAHFTEGYAKTFESVTQAGGLAAARLVLGSRSGIYTVVASTPEGNTAVTFSVRAGPLGAYQLEKGSGDNQQGVVMRTLPQPCKVTIRDRYGNPVKGTPVAVSFAGPVANSGAYFSNSSLISNDNGEVLIQAAPGIRAGSYTMQVSNNALVGSPLSFSMNAVHDSLHAVAWVTGNIQNGHVTLSTLPVQLEVALRDYYGNPVPDYPVSFTVDDMPEGAALASTTPNNLVNTGGDGRCSTYLKVGSVPGVYVVAVEPEESNLRLEATYSISLAYTIGEPQIQFPSEGYLTSNSTVCIRGVANQYVDTVLINGERAYIVKDKHYDYKHWYLDLPLMNGVNAFRCQSFDAYNNAGPSTNVTVYRDSILPVKPTVCIDGYGLDDGDRFLVGESPVTLSGQAEVGTRVDLYYGDVVTAGFTISSYQKPQLISSMVVTSDRGYVFTVNTNVFVPGDNNIFIVSSDIAKNTSISGIVLVKSVERPVIQNVKLNGFDAVDSDEIARRVAIEADIFAANEVQSVFVRFINNSQAGNPYRHVDVTGHFSTANHHLCYQDTEELESGSTYDLVITVWDRIGNSSVYLINDLTVEAHAGSGIAIEGSVLAYPNPFNPKDGAYIQYVLSQSVSTCLKIYSMELDPVKELTFAEGENGARGGRNKVFWDGTDNWGNTVPYGGYIIFICNSGNKLLGKVKLVGY